jgi:LmbE family N-acetylglucosaminyl deacetylase
MRTIIVAPHPDDEVLGVGGTLLRQKSEGATVAWLIFTSISSELGFDEAKIKQREDEIKRIKAFFGFDAVFELKFPTTQLDQVSMSTLVSEVSNIFNKFEPAEVFVPYPFDAHSDHSIVFNATVGCTKWFRHPYIKRVLAYETLSETDFSLIPGRGFKPNVFVDIDLYLDRKLQALNIYSSEMGEFPFPRSDEAVRALAVLRGAASGFHAAEAFELLRERY